MPDGGRVILTTDITGRREAEARFLAAAESIPDGLAILDAEDRFDLSDRLADIRCPVLVVGGDRDGFYSPDLFAKTADGVANGRLALYPGVGHVGVMRLKQLPGDVLDFLDH